MMMKALVALLSVSILVSVVAASSAFAAPPSASVTVGPGGQSVFDPASATVRMGGTVTWTWGSSNHSISDSSGLGLWDSGVLGAGSTFSFTFVGAGKSTTRAPRTLA